ncbi:peptidylprolyl isomerase [Cereibacter azotoformans]|uniref:Parvulin-like PPIase n=1 Tax=Cereibacter azotoformans TaxID=43057 RepID=A0A2T5K8H7_9RHOB|nr:peptidylprolyl isomerase [Cereibacter azotoformans]AXQ94861.1 peptidylprolyl isomerase [Cereibacter sphaeroides]MBO4170273.1 peptidylprolyl isomerase [Cereibacter azotoformans]PTR18730.1 peptidyl-prolyl cis-trans isomerase C [Cereibacter azotoformans]UIJ30435.1 peptidylprolyl isomerase [Cereibacter azotoformans]ULB11088.1 peptidylprolyl isomerase [Cereibacter azotoformans]
MANIARFWRGASVAALCALALAAPVRADEVTADTVVATVNGQEITLGHMIALRAGLPDQYQSLPDEALFKGILEQLIQQAALSQSVEGTVTKRDQLSLQNEERGFLSAVAMRRVVEGAVTDEALQAAYDARFADAAEQTEYNASHILVETEEEATKLKAEIEGGADFADMAREHSSDGAAANGGSLGWFGLGMMVKPFEDAVVGMKPGEVAGPIETQFGWHLVKLNETRIAEKPTLDEMRDELAGQIEQEAIARHIDEVTAKATIVRPGEGIDPATLRKEELLD